MAVQFKNNVMFAFPLRTFSNRTRIHDNNNIITICKHVINTTAVIYLYFRSTAWLERIYKNVLCDIIACVCMLKYCLSIHSGKI